jgi:hypothetical protein
VIEYPCARAHAGSGIGQLATAERHAEIVVWHFSAFLARARGSSGQTAQRAAVERRREAGMWARVEFLNLKRNQICSELDWLQMLTSKAQKFWRNFWSQTMSQGPSLVIATLSNLK